MSFYKRELQLLVNYKIFRKQDLNYQCATECEMAIDWKYSTQIYHSPQHSPIHSN